MSNAYSILVSVHPLLYQGQKILENRWPDFIYSLRNHLHKNGLEDNNSSDELLLFNYNHPFSAFTSTINSLEQVKKEIGWKKSAGSLPVQVILHYEKKGSSPSATRETTNIWDTLSQESIYITRQLKLQWKNLMSGKVLPPHSFESEGSGLFLVKLSDKSKIESNQLFSHREIPLRWKLTECFYCGMNNHSPAKCPSKFLSMESQGIHLVGYLSFLELNRSFKTAFNQQKKMNKTLLDGVSAGQVRKNIALQTFVSYFDINRVFQPRFLWNISFAGNNRWETLSRPDKVAPTNRNMHLGLDCLRVGQYSQAEELFSKESLATEGKPFFAYIGMAFVAIEQNKPKDILHFLEKANAIGGPENERVYVALLLSRYYSISNDNYKAEQAANNAFAISRSCLEAQYRRIQIAVKNGFNEKVFKELQAIVLGQKEIFIVALMDPSLIPIQGLVDDMLSSQIQSMTQNARENMGKASKNEEISAEWFESKDKEMLSNKKTFENLQSQLSRNSYYDLLDVCDRANGLSYSYIRIRENRVSEIRNHIQETNQELGRYRRYWTEYPYKIFFKKFTGKIQRIKLMLMKSKALAEKNNGKAFQKAEQTLANAIFEIKRLEPLVQKMNSTKLMITWLKEFFKKFIYSEVAIIIISLLLIAIIATIPPADQEEEKFIAIIQKTELQKQCFMALTFIVAPLIALGSTILTLGADLLKQRSCDVFCTFRQKSNEKRGHTR
jgi:hypothetical protein